MNLNDVKRLIRLVESSDIDELEIQNLTLNDSRIDVVLRRYFEDVSVEVRRRWGDASVVVIK
jgi:hypothetical protein